MVPNFFLFPFCLQKFFCPSKSKSAVGFSFRHCKVKHTFRGLKAFFRVPSNILSNIHSLFQHSFQHGPFSPQKSTVKLLENVLSPDGLKACGMVIKRPVGIIATGYTYFII